MKILIDIGHPAHVHYFKNFIIKFINSGHQIKIIARDKEVTFNLLEKYKLNFVSRGKGGTTFIGKVFYYPYAIFKFVIESYIFKPDYFLAFASTYLPFSSFLLQKPLITADDTEHDKLSQFLYKTFSSIILTPIYFNKDLGKRHVKINTVFELGSLHPNVFLSDKHTNEIINDEKYALIRFVEWNATHDINEVGFSLESKRNIVNELSKHLKVYISSEGILPWDLEKYRLKIPPHKMHEFLYNAEIFIGESGTMGVEAALIGTPSVMFSSSAKKIGNFIALRDDYSLLIICDSEKELFKSTLDIIFNKNSKNIWKKRAEKFMNSKIDFTSFLLWLFDDYKKNSSFLLKNKFINNF